MSKQQVCMDGPFEIELKVQITNGEGQDGAITYTLPKGTMPTKDSIDAAIKTCSKTAQEHGMRLMTREEAMQGWLASPIPVAIPGPKRWTEDQLKAWGL